MMIINFKTYNQGDEVYKLIKLIEKKHKKAILCLEQTDLHFSNKTKLDVFSQHVDYQEKGRSTGFVIPEAIKSKSAKGSLLNHSEHKISLKDIKKTLNRCNKLNLRLIVCASSLREVKEIKKFNPYAIAYEDPKFIGTGKSITKNNPQSIIKFVNLLKKSKILPFCGAGISNSKDYSEALKLGCKGVLISSAIVNSKNPNKLLKSIKRW